MNEAGAPTRGELKQLREVQADHGQRLLTVEAKATESATRIGVLEGRAPQWITTADFAPVKWVVYGIAGTALAAVATALVATVVGGSRHLMF
jgi:hypothetical protein